MVHLKVVRALPVTDGGIPTTEKYDVGKFLLGARLADSNKAYQALERVMANVGFPNVYDERDFEVATFRMGEHLYQEEMILYREEVGDDFKAIERASYEIYMGTEILDHIVLQGLVGRILYVRRMAMTNANKNAQS